jgi:hypothetical protein
MKAIVTAVLVACACLPCRAVTIHKVVSPPMPQPPPPVGLGLGLNWCIGLAIVAATGYILRKCGAEYYLCISQAEGEEPCWFVSQGTVATLAKTGSRRCEGPWTDRAEPDRRAMINNESWAQLGVVFYPCGPLGTVPGPSPVPVRMTMEQSTDFGNTWAGLASVVTDADDGCPFGLLPTTGTNGMARATLLEYAGCSMLATNSAGAHALFRVRYEHP